MLWLMLSLALSNRKDRPVVVLLMETPLVIIHSRTLTLPNQSVPCPFGNGSRSDFGQGDVKEKLARRLWGKSSLLPNSRLKAQYLISTNHESCTFVGEHLSKFYLIHYSENQHNDRWFRKSIYIYAALIVKWRRECRTALVNLGRKQVESLQDNKMITFFNGKKSKKYCSSPFLFMLTR